MQQHTRSIAVCEGGGPRLPNGQQVGSYSEEDENCVWTRSVCQKHLLRFLDAWTVNEGVLRQVSMDRISLIRYRAREGVYEITLSDFLDKATLLRAFACDEDVYALPRDAWSFTDEPESGQLLLFQKRDDE